MATPNTPDILALEQVPSTTEAPSRSAILTHTKAGLAMVVLAVGISGNAVAQDKVNANSSPLAVVATQEITLKDGQKTSFALLAKMPQAEQEATLEKMKRIDRSGFREWEQQVAVNDLKQVKAEGQVITQRANAEIERFADNVRVLLAAKKKLDDAVKKGIIDAIAYGKPPETIKFLQTVLNNQNNFV